MDTKTRIVMAALGVVCAGQARAADHYVSPSGAASWDASRNINTPCSLATANTNASAGDTVILSGGTYDTGIQPRHSGQRDGRIVYRAKDGETPVITGADITGIRIDSGKQYIEIDGVTVSHVRSLAQLVDGAAYNEIANCRIHDGGHNPTAGVIIWSMTGQPSSHNWIHDCEIYGAGYADSNCNDEGYLIKIGIFSYDNSSGNNTFENNRLYWGGHHILETNTSHNVFRNNVIHNEGWMEPNASCAFCTDSSGKYGNRNFGIDGPFNLIERNRFGHAGLPPDGNGSDGIAIADKYNIVRYNDIFNNGEDGAYFRYGSNVGGGDAPAEGNVFYNNTLYHNGHHDDCRADMVRRGIQLHGVSAIGNFIVNNLLWDNGAWPSSGEIGCTGTGNNARNCGTNSVVNNWTSDREDPLFANTDITNPMSPTLPDLSLKPESPCLNQGIFLTTATVSGAPSRLVTVVNALYFQDGTWGSSLASLNADWISIGEVSNTVQIESINYERNEIALREPKTWNTGDRVWLYSNSSGVRVLYGAAPDCGAHEYDPATTAFARKPAGQPEGGRTATMTGIPADVRTVFDARGRVLHGSASGPSGRGRSPGVYFVRWRQGGAYYTVKQAAVR